jgi:penicillin-binding protein 2
VNLIGAIEQSCDVYFYQLSQRLGVENWAEYARECGFGRRTGIDLPEEAAGLVPDSAYYDRRYGKRGWTSSLVLNLGIGQGEILSTPLQLAVFYAAIANGGATKRPRVFHSLMVSGSETIRGGSEDGLHLPFSRETLATLQHALRQVVAGEHGTAKVVNFPDLDVAGKTGTAQNPHGENHSWFACYAPYDEPEIVIVALVENAGQGSEVAAPLCGEILRFYFGLPEQTLKTAEPLAADAETPPSADLPKAVTPE